MLSLYLAASADSQYTERSLPLPRPSHRHPLAIRIHSVSTAHAFSCACRGTTISSYSPLSTHSLSLSLSLPPMHRRSCTSEAFHFNSEAHLLFVIMVGLRADARVHRPRRGRLGTGALTTRRAR